MPLAFSGARLQNSRMVFADLKNDFVFRRIFATHPEILRGLLNDLLERTGDRTIESLEYLPSEQLPRIPGLKLSILDVRCKDCGGAFFIVAIQLMHIADFLNPVVYNGSKAYSSQLKARESYTKLVDVVVLAICNFVMWPDVEEDKLQEPHMPMHSRFALAEETTGNRKLLQVQFAFLELPKVPKEKPAGGAALWAWLFANAPKLKAVPEALPVGPTREAMELANEATFSVGELEAYHKVLDEIQQARDYGETKEAVGLEKGLLKGKRDALTRLITRLNVALSDEDRARIANATNLRRLIGGSTTRLERKRRRTYLRDAGALPSGRRRRFGRNGGGCVMRRDMAQGEIGEQCGAAEFFGGLFGSFSRGTAQGHDNAVNARPTPVTLIASRASERRDSSSGPHPWSISSPAWVCRASRVWLACLKVSSEPYRRPIRMYRSRAFGASCVRSRVMGRYCQNDV